MMPVIERIYQRLQASGCVMATNLRSLTLIIDGLEAEDSGPRNYPSIIIVHSILEVDEKSP